MCELKKELIVGDLEIILHVKLTFKPDVTRLVALKKQRLYDGCDAEKVLYT